MYVLPGLKDWQTRKKSENWNIIKKTEDSYLPSNAFVLLTGEHFRYSKTQCAVFAETDRGEFLDKKEFDGSLYEQIEHAYSFVLRNIYDDRLEVTSPGSLCYGLTLEEALSGRSKQRNRAVAEIFSQMGLIETWGTGLKNIRR